jgi:hypothetical protein
VWYLEFERNGESSGSATDDAILALNELHEASLEAARTRPASAMLSLVLADMNEVIKRLKASATTTGASAGVVAAAVAAAGESSVAEAARQGTTLT